MKSIIKKFGLTVAAAAIIFTGCKESEKTPVVPAFSPDMASVQEGSGTTVSITAGTAPFRLESPAIVEASVSGSTISINGKTKGNAVIKVTGDDGGTANLAVVVTEKPANAPALSTSAVEIDEEGLTATVAISGGTPAFTAVSAHPNIATVAVSGTTVTVTGQSMGTTLVTVKGSDNASATFAVSVKGEQIFFGPDNTQIGNGNKSFYIEKNHTIKKGVYTMVGWIYVTDGATLTIEPGTIIKGTDYNWDGVKSATGSSLVIRMGAKIMANGEKPDGTIEPIVFTSAKPKGQRQATDWGGIILLGRAKNNQGTMMIEGGVDAPHGGSDDNDNSGVMRFVRLEFGGYPYALDNEINGLTMGSVGRGTTLEYIQVSYAGDDSFEWFGGSVNCKHLVAYHGWDDEFDTDNGFSGKLQFLLSVRDPKIADQSNSNGFESDNNATGATQTPYTTAVFSNVTIIGPMGQDPNFTNYDILFNPANVPAGIPSGSSAYISGYTWGNTTGAAFPIRTGIFQSAMQIRRNSRISCFNSVFTGFPVGLMIVPGDAASGSTANYGSGSHKSAEDGLLKVKNVFFAGMGKTGADVDSKTHAWVGLGPDGKNFSAEYFNNEPGNHEFVPANQTYEAILASIEELKLKQFQSKKLPIPATGFAAEEPTANWGPVAGSPLLNAASFIDSFLDNDFFEKVNYVGAFKSEKDEDNWLKGWANFDPQNTDY